MTRGMVITTRAGDRAAVRRILDGLDTAALAGRYGPRARTDLAQVVRACFESLVQAIHSGAAPPEHPVRRTAAIAARWAELDLPMELLQRAVYASALAALDVLGRDAAVAMWPAATGRPAAGTGTVLIEALGALSAAVARGYVRGVRALAIDAQGAAMTWASGLLAGHADPAGARRRGIEPSDSYLVVALVLAPHPQESDPRLDARVVACRKLRRVQAELALGRAPRAVSLLSVDGGTILIPGPRDDEHRLDTLVARLARAAGAAVTATVVPSARESVPRAADLAHELLDLAVRLRRVPGLYRFRDLAGEYQLARPGRAHEHIAAVLDPLRAEPELLDTLRAFLTAHDTREAMARGLGVSVGAARRRLARIRTLTGLDPESATGAWQLRAGLIARGLIDGSHASGCA